MAASTRNHAFLLLWLTTLFSLGLLFFSRGFLLKRITLHHRNNCTHELHQNSCRFPPSFSRSVFIIIDGLRYDFARWNDTAINPKPYQNKLLTINQVLSRHPDRSRLYKFIADPPTTTMQRIKALTTGSLPTFVDMGSNFASYEITEDNLIDQLIEKRKKIVFMGDDTWISLFPDKFYEEFAFPSFNVKDLDTVDNGILERLIPTMKNEDWDVIIAHFLGVDHCGHTFGPDHPIMGQKLNQLDLILKSVVSNLREDTILFVLGDHGMSTTGDHGGDSVDEVSSALFVYSGGQKFGASTKMSIMDQVVNQIDLVPSFSLLLGVPIPFGNLGSFIEDLVPRDLVPLAYYANSYQVNRYLSSYVDVADDISKSDWIRLQEYFKDIEKNYNLLKKNPDLITKFVELSSTYLKESVSMCRRIWATFDTSLMFVGIVFISLGIISAFLMSFLTQPTCNYSLIFLSTLSILLFSLNLILPSHLTFYISLSTAFLQLLIFISTIRSQISLKLPKLDKINTTSTLILLILFLFPFSNSYIINEASTLSFLTNFLLLITSSSFQIPKPKKPESTTTFHQQIRLILLLLFALTTRLSLNLQRCRDEQFWCIDFTTYFPQSPLWLPVLTLCVIPFIILRFLRRAGNLNANSFTVLSVKYLTGICCACVCYTWALASLPLKLRNLLSSWQEVWFPRVAFLCLIVEFLSVLISPMFVYLLPQSDAISYPGTPSSSISDLFQYVKSNWRHLTTVDQTRQLPLVYGLATVYSAPILVTTMIISLLTMILLGQIHSLSMIFLLSSLFLSLIIVSVKKTEFTRQASDLFKVSWSNILIWSLQSSLFFFVTGHQSTISSIQWNAAFVGVDDDMTSHVIPAIKILFNTFASQLIFSISLQLLPIWPFTLHVLFPSIGFRYVTTEQVRQGEMTLYHHQDDLKRESFRCTVLFIFIRGLILLSAILSASLHKRHLMVWKLFAPRFIFESIAFIFSLLASLIGFGLVVRINLSVNRWMNLLEKRSQ